jgi:hypothetical protein
VARRDAEMPKASERVRGPCSVMGANAVSRQNSMLPWILLAATVFMAVTTTNGVSNRKMAWISFGLAWAVAGILGYFVLARASAMHVAGILPGTGLEFNGWCPSLLSSL